jgi:hypothetical protein
MTYIEWTARLVYLTLEQQHGRQIGARSYINHDSIFAAAEHNYFACIDVLDTIHTLRSISMLR